MGSWGELWWPIMRTYYSDDEIEVTSTSIWVSGVDYPLDALESTWRGGGRFAARGIVIGMGVILAAGLYRIGASYAWWSGDVAHIVGQIATLGGWAIAVVSVLALGATLAGVFAVEGLLVGVEYLRGHGRHRELWARVWGLEVLLLRTSDRARFERVCRALRRALSDRRDPG